MEGLIRCMVMMGARVARIQGSQRLFKLQRHTTEGGGGGGHIKRKRRENNEKVTTLIKTKGGTRYKNNNKIISQNAKEQDQETN